MEEVRGKYVSPAIDRLAFNCPHCDALARQFWFSVHADPLKSDEKPVVATAETVKTLTFGDVEEAERERKLTWAEPVAAHFLKCIASSGTVMFRTFRSPTVFTATRCVFGCTISWSGLDAPGIQSQSSMPRLMCGASARRQPRRWRHHRAAQPLFFV